MKIILQCVLHLFFEEFKYPSIICGKFPKLSLFGYFKFFFFCDYSVYIITPSKIQL